MNDDGVVGPQRTCKLTEQSFEVLHAWYAAIGRREVEESHSCRRDHIGLGSRGGGYLNRALFSRTPSDNGAGASPCVCRPCRRRHRRGRGIRRLPRDEALGTVRRRLRRVSGKVRPARSPGARGSSARPPSAPPPAPDRSGASHSGSAAPSPRAPTEGGAGRSPSSPSRRSSRWSPPPARAPIAASRSGSRRYRPSRRPRRRRGAGVALASSDSGRSWSEALVRGPAVQFAGGLACPSTADCYATASSLAGPASAGFLLASTDGGVSWTTRRPGPRYGLGGALACSAVSRCFAAGGPGGIVATSDGGLRWVDESEPIGAGGRLGVEALACSSLTTCVGVGIEPSPGYPVIMTTRDGGSSSALCRARSPEQQSGRALNEVSTGEYLAVSCSGLRCAAVADTFTEIGLLAESSDGGRTWRESALGRGGSFSGVTCAAAGGCVAAARSVTARRSSPCGSSGHPWTKRYVGPSTDFSSLSCPSTQHCVAAGGAGPVPVAGRRWRQATTAGRTGRPPPCPAA